MTKSKQLPPVDSTFTFWIYDRHVVEKLEENGNLNFQQIDDDYKTFNYTFDFNFKKIKDYQHVALFYDRENCLEATRVAFTDGTYVNAVGSHNTFKNNVYPSYLTKIEQYYRYMDIQEKITQFIAEDQYKKMTQPARTRKRKNDG